MTHTECILERPIATLSEERLSNLAYEEVNAFLQSVKQSPIEFNYRNGNCHVRAHMVSAMAATQGIRTMKIWAFAPGLYSLVDSNLIKLNDHNHLAPDNVITWGYHVAPVILSGTEKLVIDPSLFPEKPVTWTEWLDKLATPNLAYVFLDAELYLFNTLNNLFVVRNGHPYAIAHGQQTLQVPGLFKRIVTGDFWKYDGESRDNNELAKGLAVDSTAYAFIASEINSARSGTLEDYKKLVGVIRNFETVFRDHQTNEDIGIEILERHATVIHKYKTLFLENFSRWKKFIEDHNSGLGFPS